MYLYSLSFHKRSEDFYEQAKKYAILGSGRKSPRVRLQRIPINNKPETVAVRTEEGMLSNVRKTKKRKLASVEPTEEGLAAIVSNDGGTSTKVHKSKKHEEPIVEPTERKLPNLRKAKAKANEAIRNNGKQI